MNEPLFVTALLSLIGVSFAAIINYICNIRINNKKIRCEEKKMIASFLLESLSNLKIAAEELRKMNINVGRDKNGLALLTEYAQRALNIFDSVKLYLNKDERYELEKEYKSIQDEEDNIQLKYIVNGIGSMDGESVKNILIRKTKFRHKLSEIINFRIANIADKLRDFDI